MTKTRRVNLCAFFMSTGPVKRAMLQMKREVRPFLYCAVAFLSYFIIVQIVCILKFVTTWGLVTWMEKYVGEDGELHALIHTVQMEDLSLCQLRCPPLRDQGRHNNRCPDEGSEDGKTKCTWQFWSTFAGT